jgi:O-antigen biosynthesis protein
MIAPDKFASLSRAIAASTKPRLLFITHAWGGGIERHVLDLISTIRAKADVLVLRGFLNGGVELAWHTESSAIESVRVGGFADATLNEWVRALDALAFARIHLHHIHGWPRTIVSLIEQLDCPLDVTLHDYASICPQYHLSDENGRYCGEPDPVGCRACIEKRPHAWALQIGDWRELMRSLLVRAERVIAPSQDVAARITRYCPTIVPLVWPHAEVEISVPSLNKIAILGGLSPVKGLAVVRAVAAYAKRHAPHFEFRLIGHAAEPLPPGVTATGSYDEAELPRLIASERPDVIWFPAQVPETFSYTLSVAIASGMRIVASDLGSFRERLAAVNRHALVAHDATNAQWIAALEDNGGGTSLNKRTASTAEYAARYLDPLQMRADCLPPQTQLLRDLLPRDDAPTEQGSHAAIDIFRVGRYGGHRASLDVIEREIERLEPGETGFVGSAVYLRTARELEGSSEALKEIRFHLDDSNRQLAETRRHFEAATGALEQRESEIEGLQRQARSATRRIEQLEKEFARVTQSRSWKITRPLRGMTAVWRASPQILRRVGLALREPKRIAHGIELLRDKGIAGTVRHFADKSTVSTSALALAIETPRIEPLRLSTHEQPTLSIVIPVYEQHETTFGCLRSIADFRPSMPFEVIVMDDASPTPASDALSAVAGVRFVRNEKNLGFLGNVNRGANEARGEYLLLLNNDTLLTASAIDALINTFRDHENVGLVGGKLVNADGSLQEAGGIVWRDGSAWNWGRGEHPHDPRFNFVRDTDYCSGAAIAIKRELFLDLGGFDAHFAPAYYEDTDLAFRVRERGLRVLYQPHAEVYHLEGVSHGRDQTSGIKAYQVTNAAKFFERWQMVLATHRAAGKLAEREVHRKTKLSVLIVEAFLITPDQDSGSLRLFNIMRLLISEGHQVTFIAENLEGTSKYRNLIEGIGVEVLHGEWARSVNHVLRSRARDYDVVMFCRHYVASTHIDTARLYAPKARILFDTVDLHFLREEREAALLASEQALAAAQKTKAEELSLCRRADTTIVVSDVEKKLLAKLAPSAQVEILSNVHRMEMQRPTFDERSGVLFVGGFRHPPNIDAVKWYAKYVLPIICARAPDVVTRIVGSNMPEEIYALRQPGLEILGFVEDIKPILRRSRVSIAPLRYGAGVKGKVNEAMNFGIPVVATALAVEGMHMKSGHDCLIAEDPETFATHVLALHTDTMLWQKISGNAVASVEAHFSMTSALEALRRILSVVPLRT